jgi:hypothetical protein
MSDSDVRCPECGLESQCGKPIEQWSVGSVWFVAWDRNWHRRWCRTCLKALTAAFPFPFIESASAGSASVVADCNPGAVPSDHAAGADFVLGDER